MLIMAAAASARLEIGCQQVLNALLSILSKEDSRRSQDSNLDCSFKMSSFDLKAFYKKNNLEITFFLNSLGMMVATDIATILCLKRHHVYFYVNVINFHHESLIKP